MDLRILRTSFAQVHTSSWAARLEQQVAQLRGLTNLRSLGPSENNLGTWGAASGVYDCTADSGHIVQYRGHCRGAVGQHDWTNELRGKQTAWGERSASAAAHEGNCVL
jgi:hypothetical protein